MTRPIDKQKKTPQPAAAAPKTAAGRSGHIPFSGALPYLLITGAAAIFYWPILSAQGWFWNDFPEQNFIYRLFAAVHLKQGVFPFWNPYVFSGMPFFADVQAAVLYPLNLLLTPFASATWLSPLLVEYQIILHVVLAGIFIYWLCRDFGCGTAAGVLGAIAFMFCGTFTAHIFHTNLIQSSAWLPLIVLLFKRMMERRSLFHLALCSLTLAAAFLAGYPQLMLYTYYWLGAYGLFLIWKGADEKHESAKPDLRRKGLQAALFAAVVALSIGMTSVQLLPTNELGKNSSRPSLEFHESCEGSLHTYRVVTLLVPKFFGTPQGTYWGIGADDVRGGVHYFWETAAYCGILTLLLALFAVLFAPSPTVFFLAAIAMVAFVLSMGDSLPFYQIAYSILPGFKQFRIPGRFAFFVQFSVSILAAIGLQALLDRANFRFEKRRKLALGLIIGAGAAAMIAALVVSTGSLKEWVIDFMLSSRAFGSNAPAIGQYVENELYPSITGGFDVFALFAVLSCLLIGLRFFGKISPKVTAAGAVIILFADMMIYGYGFAASPDNPETIYRSNPSTQALQQELNSEFFRINSRDSKPGTDDLGGRHLLFNKNEGSVHSLFLMEGYNPLRLKHEIAERGQAALDILNVKYAIQVDPATGQMGLGPNPTYLPRARMVYRYEVVADPDRIMPLLRSGTFDHVNTVILEQQPTVPQGTETSPGSSQVKITGYGLNRIDLDVTTEKSGLLVLSEIHYPCWKATVDGAAAPLYRADYALRAIAVPAGSHRVACYYEDSAFRTGRTISLVALLLTLAALGIGILGRRRPTSTSNPADGTSHESTR